MCLLDTTRTIPMNLSLFSGIGSTSSMYSSKSVEKSSHLAFSMLKRLLNGVCCGTITGWTVTQIRRCCVQGIVSKTDFSHISEMFEDAKMRSGVYP